MADVFDINKRSQIMSKVKSKANLSTEIRLISLFKQYSIKGWRRNYRVVGHPDFVFLSRHLAIFVDGCFWHGHSCRNTQPKQNADYWREKQERNKARDSQVTTILTQKGWHVVRIWECELRQKHREVLVEKLKPLMKNT